MLLFPDGKPVMSDLSLLSGISGLSLGFPFQFSFGFFLPSPIAPFCLVPFLLMVHCPDFFFFFFFSKGIVQYSSLKGQIFCMSLVE